MKEVRFMREREKEKACYLNDLLPVRALKLQEAVDYQVTWPLRLLLLFPLLMSGTSARLRHLRLHFLRYCSWDLPNMRLLLLMLMFRVRRTLIRII